MNYTIIEPDAREICEKYGVSMLTGKLFAAAELTDEDIAEILREDTQLRTSKADCVLQACYRLIEAKNTGEKVFIGGDYDADGICSTAIMKKTLQVLGVRCGFYIPDRFKEGYGLSAATVEKAYEKGYSVILTVDNGVKAHEALQRAKELGMYVIVTDHHRIEEEVEADIVVHPDYMEPEYRYLSGAGVVLEMSRNLIGEHDDLTVMAAVAAIGDAMPYRLETRRIIRRGMDLLKQGRPRSLASLLRPGSSADPTAIAFQIVPMLNSVGRMNDISNVNTVPQFLLAEDENTILKYKTQLESVNATRKEMTSAQMKTAEAAVGEEAFPVVYSEEFHEGICGILAGRLTSKYGRPSLVLTRSGSLVKGSGRSVEGFDLFAFFSQFDYLEAFGGHAMAVGLSLKYEDLDRFRKDVQERMENVRLETKPEEKKAIAIRADDITLEAAGELSRIEPWPKEWQQPVFAVTDAQQLQVYRSAKVTRYRLACRNQDLEAVVFANRGIACPDDPRIIIGTLGINRYRNQISCQITAEELE